MRRTLSASGAGNHTGPFIAQNLDAIEGSGEKSVEEIGCGMEAKIAEGGCVEEQEVAADDGRQAHTVSTVSASEVHPRRSLLVSAYRAPWTFTGSRGSATDRMLSRGQW